jgi:hypothetical protein
MAPAKIKGISVQYQNLRIATHVVDFIPQLFTIGPTGKQMQIRDDEPASHSDIVGGDFLRHDHGGGGS